MDLYSSNYFFYFVHFMQLILLDLVAWALIYYSGYDNWFTYFLAAALMATAQVIDSFFFNFQTLFNLINNQFKQLLNE